VEWEAFMDTPEDQTGPQQLGNLQAAVEASKINPWPRRQPKNAAPHHWTRSTFMMYALTCGQVFACIAMVLTPPLAVGLTDEIARNCDRSFRVTCCVVSGVGALFWHFALLMVFTRVKMTAGN
jgi:hypothetical protein